MHTTLLENYSFLLYSFLLLIDLTDLISLLNNLIYLITHSLTLTGDWVFLMILVKPNTNVTKDSKLNPFYVTGFSDAESTFGVYTVKNSRYSAGWAVTVLFQIRLHLKDKELLERIKTFFGVGSIYVKNNVVIYRVQSLKDLMDVIIPHFTKYTLLTKKNIDFTLFKEIVFIINNKDHLTKEGVQKIISLRALMNTGLSDELKKAFPKYNIIDKYIATTVIQGITDPNWLVGFVDGEGCFSVYIKQSKTISIGFQVLLRFQITQHYRDVLLLNNIINYLGCGHLHKLPQAFDVIVDKFKDINNKIIPFFDKYPLLGSKLLNYQDFCKVAKLMNSKDHLTPKGLEEIRLLKSCMNNKRIN
jgi:hypothetical protein